MLIDQKDNIQYNYVRNALAFNDVIHALSLNLRLHQMDEVESLMWQVCIKKMKEYRDSYSIQGGITLIDHAEINLEQSDDSSGI